MFTTFLSHRAARGAAQLILVLATACDASKSQGPLPPTEPRSLMATVTVSNEAGATLGAVEIRLCGTPIGSALAAVPALEVGAVATFSVSAGCYDIVAAASGGFTWLVAARNLTAGTLLTVHVLPGGLTSVEQLSELVMPRVERDRDSGGRSRAGSSVR